jgi:hypothetical protein
MSKQISTRHYDLDTPDIIEGPLSVDLIRVYNLRARFFRIGMVAGIIWVVLIIIRQFYAGYPNLLQTAIFLAIGATAIPFAIGVGTYVTEINLKRAALKRLEQKNKDW